MSRNVLELSSTYRALKEEALAEGIAEGLARGVTEGIAKGVAEGLAKGLAEGKAQEARRLIVRLGTPRLGEPTPETIAVLENISEAETLEGIADRLFSVETWSDLLAG